MGWPLRAGCERAAATYLASALASAAASALLGAVVEAGVRRPWGGDDACVFFGAVEARARGLRGVGAACAFFGAAVEAHARRLRGGVPWMVSVAALRGLLGSR